MTCENTVGSYSCSCGQGLELDQDRRSCKGMLIILHFVTGFLTTVETKVATSMLHDTVVKKNNQIQKILYDSCQRTLSFS